MTVVVGVADPERVTATSAVAEDGTFHVDVVMPSVQFFPSIPVQASDGHKDASRTIVVLG